MASAVDEAAPVRTTVFVGSVNLIAQVADKLFSFGQIIVIAALLGSTPSGDLLFLASIVPLTIGYVVGEPVGRAFLTLLVREQTPDRARRLAASAFVLTTSALLVITALYAATACVLVLVVTPDGTGALGPWLVLSVIGPCAGVAGLLSGILLWLHDYPGAAARIPIASASGFALLLLVALGSSRLIWVATALAAGYVIAAIWTYLRVARKLGVRWGFAATRSDMLDAARVRSLIVGPAVGGAIGGQVIVTIERILAGALVGTGSVAVVSYARGIATAPTVLAQAVGASSYPRLVRAEAREDVSFLRESFVRGLRLAFFVGVGCATFLVLFGPAAVTAIFQRGQFGRLTSTQTGHVLIAFAAATLSGSLIVYLVPFIYGLNRFRSIIRLELAIFVVYLVAAPIAAITNGLTGLAIAFAVAQLGGVAVAIDVCRRATGLSWRRLGRAMVPIAVPAGAVVLALVAYRVAVDHIALPIVARGAIVVGGSGVCLFVAMAAALLLSPLPEASQLKRSLRGLSQRPVRRLGA